MAVSIPSSEPDGVAGGLAEQALSPENNLVKITKEIPFDRARLLGCGALQGQTTTSARAQDRARPSGRRSAGIRWHNCAA